MIAPFFKGYTDFIDKYSWPIRFFNLLQFYCSFSATNPSDLKKYAFYYQDSKVVTDIKLSSLVLFLDEQEYARQNARRSKTPFIILTAKDETAVSNTATKDIFDRVNSQRNKLVELEGADHMTISFDFDNAQQVVKHIVSYFDSLVELEEDRKLGFFGA